MNAILIRKYHQDRTIGTLFLTNKGDILHELRTLELPWRNNERRVSCIPEGIYDLRLRPAKESTKYKYDHLEIMNVPGRSWILFHVGNYTHEIAGCILPGLALANLDQDPGLEVANSRNAFKLLMNWFSMGNPQLIVTC